LRKASGRNSRHRWRSLWRWRTAISACAAFTTEGGPSVQNGTFVNGFYETWPIVYGEEAYGFARTGQTMLNVTDSKMIRLFVNDEPFWLPDANIRHYERQLNMKAGVSIERLFGRPPRASGFVLDRGAWFPFRSVMWRRSRMR
jgi:trehalose/maltose hydrolase-like predicted phosphorylase